MVDFAEPNNPGALMVKVIFSLFYNKNSVGDPWYFGVDSDPDPDPRIRTSD